MADEIRRRLMVNETPVKLNDAERLIPFCSLKLNDPYDDENSLSIHHELMEELSPVVVHDVDRI